MGKNLSDDAPTVDRNRDKAWEAFIKRKDVKKLFTNEFKFPLGGHYVLWCMCWRKAWVQGFKVGAEKRK